MSGDLAAFLATVPDLAGLDATSRAALAAALESASFPDRSLVLRQGEIGPGLFLLRRGTVAIRVHRGDLRETVAELSAPSVFGELSFLTGRTCSADVEARGPIEVALLTPAALAALDRPRERLLEILLRTVAARLHDTMTGATPLHRRTTVLLRADDAFRAPGAFAVEMAAGLGACSPGPTLLVAQGLGAGPDPRRRQASAWSLVERPGSPVELQERLDAWRRDFRYVVVLSTGGRDGVSERGFDAVGDLLAGGTPPADLPLESAAPGGVPLDAEGPPLRFVASDADRARPDFLSGTRQLLFDVDAAAGAESGERPAPARFRRTARSLARAVAGQQIGLALGGGGACCWAHIGLLGVLEEAGIPIDLVAGTSMGSFIAGLVSTCRSAGAMTEIAEFWRTRYRRMIELRFWRMHLISERGLRRELEGYFGDRELRDLEIPFWANAVDVETGDEVFLDRGRVSEMVRASMSLPGSSPPYQLGDRVLVDAAVMTPVPARAVRAMGAHFVIAVNVMPRMQEGSIRRRYPFRFFDVLSRCLRISGHEIAMGRCEDDADVTLSPALESYSLLDFGRCREIIRAGSDAAQRQLPQIVAGYEGMRQARA